MRKDSNGEFCCVSTNDTQNSYGLVLHFNSTLTEGHFKKSYSMIKSLIMRMHLNP